MLRRTFRAAMVATIMPVVALPVAASAAPSNEDLNAFSSYFGLESRAFVSTSGSTGGSRAVGGDLHLVLEGPPLAILLGARLSADRANGMVAFDAGGRWFPDPTATIGVSAGGGFFVGSENAQSSSFAIGTIGGIYGEAGLELPRTSPIRIVASLRLDLGGARQSADSQITPKSPYVMASINVGVFFGGQGTRARR